MHSFMLTFVLYISQAYWRLSSPISSCKEFQVKVCEEIMTLGYTLTEIVDDRDTCASVPCKMRGVSFPQGAWESITTLPR